MPAYSSLSIANAFLERARKEGVPLTGMKLHKLLYFAEGHSHALRDQRLMTDEPEAWEYAPVYPAVFREFRRFGARTISGFALESDDPSAISQDDGGPTVPSPSDEDVNRFLDAVWNAYKGMTAAQLLKMSRVSKGPWAKTLAAERANGSSREKPPISYELIANYFRSVARAAS
jgi:uncharacterized phage-associated protein